MPCRDTHWRTSEQRLGGGNPSRALVSAEVLTQVLRAHRKGRPHHGGACGGEESTQTEQTQDQCGESRPSG